MQKILKELKIKLESKIIEAEFLLARQEYEPTPQDYVLNKNGEKDYTEKYLDEMPNGFAMFLGRHSALVDLRKEIIKLEEKIKTENKMTLFDFRNN